MLLVDWSHIYRAEVVPVLSAHTAPTPMPVLIIAGAAILAGVVLLLLVPWPRNLVGLAPLLMVAFGAWAMRGNRRAAQQDPAQVRVGTVAALRIEKILTSNTTNGASEAREVHVLELTLQEAGTLDAEGAHLTATSEQVRLTTSPTIYRSLSVGDALTGVSMPTAPAFVHLRVGEDGQISR